MRFSFFVVFFWLAISWAALPKASLILQRTSENAGNGIYQIDQEVQFPNGQDTLILRETWMIENENNMKLIVTGVKELKDQVAFSIQISNGVRTQGAGPKRITDDFIERYFHFRSAENLAASLAHLKIVPNNVLRSKSPKNIKDIDFQPESFVRLTRSGGVITYAFGPPATPERETPGFWIEQDQFVIRKFRLPSEIEVIADRYSNYSRGLMFPRTRVVRWGNNQITIQTVSVSAKSKDAMAKFGLKSAPKMEALSNQQAASVIEEFYKRFR